MPHSIFTGRVREPGEPLFLREDTDLALALAEEEQATCPSCGLLKAWCRDAGNQFVFVPYEEQCHATHALARHKEKVNEARDAPTREATQMGARFKDGHRPDLTAGLDLPEDAAD